MVSIATNYTSLFSQRAVAIAQNSIEKSLERLATGLRINHAGDDPAGLAMATTMSAKLRSSGQALRNVNDGISLTATAEGALQEVDNLLIRMRELTVQSLNGTLSATDRLSIQNELSSYVAQIDGIAKGTEFNGINLLDKSRQHIAIQSGINAQDVVDVLLNGVRALDLGAGGTVSMNGGSHATAALTGSTSGVMSINGETINPVNDGGSSSFGDGSAKALADAINALGIKNLGATARSGSISLGVASPTTVLVPDPTPLNPNNKKPDTLPVTFQPGNFVINGYDFIGFQWDKSSPDTLSQAIVKAINANAAQCGVNASFNGGIVLESTNPGNGYNIQVQSNGASSQTVFSGFDLKKLQDLTVIGSISVTSERAFTVDGGLNGGSQGWSIEPGIYCSLSTLESIDLALKQVSEYRAELGSTQNLLESEARTLQNQYENLSTAHSRIMDTDIAQESAALIKNTILRQAGIAILAQANQMPNIALSLLHPL